MGMKGIKRSFRKIGRGGIIGVGVGLGIGLDDGIGWGIFIKVVKG